MTCRNSPIRNSRKNSALDDNFEEFSRENNSDAKRESTRIAVIYSIVGCLWILVTDMLEVLAFNADYSIIQFSILKGLLYVFISAIFIYCITYPPIKKVLAAKNALDKANEELEKSNGSYKQLCAELEAKQALTKSLINSIPDLLFYKNMDSVYLGCNKAYEEFVGKRENEIIGKTDFDLFEKETAELHIALDIDILTSNSLKKSEDQTFYPGGRSVCLETQKSPYYNANMEMIGIIGIGRDISERKTREERIEYLSYHDSLTGQYNRAYYQVALSRMEGAEHLPISIIIGDVNGLKLINDAFGHMEGDKILIEIADILKKCTRASDVVARIGGDEFSILLPNTDAQSAKSIADDIREECKLRLSNNIVYTNIALGYATKNTEDESFDKIAVLAEDNMYRRKLLESQSLRSSVLVSIKTTMFEKSNETKEHAERLSDLSKDLGLAIGLPEEMMDELELVATLHDIGKISIDRNILSKTEKLSQEEWREIKKHPEVGYRIAYSCSELRHIAYYILCHHERWDGKGYPQGLFKDNIPIISRIISITDAYDAMTEDRTYRKALSREEAINELIENAGTQFDPVLVSAFLDKVINR